MGDCVVCSGALLFADSPRYDRPSSPNTGHLTRAQLCHTSNPDFWTPRRLYVCALVSSTAPRVWVTALSAWPYRTWPTARDERYIKALTSTHEILEIPLVRNPDLSRAVRTSHAHEHIALSARQFLFVCNRKRARAALPWACYVIQALRKKHGYRQRGWVEA